MSFLRIFSIKDIIVIGSSIPISSTIIPELPFLLVMGGSFVILALLFRYFSKKSSK